MILPVRVRDELKAERGIYITEACLKCGSLIGPVRWTRAGEDGVWCSARCRDGTEAEARRTGRPRKYKNHAEKQKAYRSRRIVV
ncbi:MAG: hypothetical protein ACRD3B_20285 [Candidatus Sulfotelmatobacter sp.]